MPSTAPTLEAPTEPAAPPIRAGAGRGDRVLGAVVSTVALAVLLIATRLHPDPSGMGTHTQLHLPNCGFQIATTYPCPTCGMTTAFAHAARAEPWAAVRVQPFGAMMALATAAAFWGGLHVAVFGSALGRIVSRLLAPWIVWIIAAAALASWAYKIGLVVLA